MRRRVMMLMLGGAVITGSPALRAQQKAMTAIGLLSSASPAAFAPFVSAFREGLAKTGFVESQNLAVEYRWAEGRFDCLPALAADLLARNVDAIVAAGGDVAALAAKRATSTTPIVFVIGADPIEDGLIASLARPGGNVTGVTFFGIELMSKRLALLSELLAPATVIALLVNPDSPTAERIIADVRQAADAKGWQLQIVTARTAGEIDAAFASMVQLHAGALLLGGNVLFTARREQIVALAARYALPAMYDVREFPDSGGLISYGASIPSAYREAGIYTGRVLKGARPADLPVLQPTTFELVINLKTAKALGLSVPQSLLVRADEVIE